MGKRVVAADEWSTAQVFVSFLLFYVCGYVLQEHAALVCNVHINNIQKRQLY